jgi:hypothetical protein
MSATELAELSYEAAIRALDLQERAVEQLRARTGSLLAASSLTASFFGTQVIRADGRLNPLSGLALISLIGSIGLCVYVLLPKRRLVFGANALRMYESLLRVADDAEEVRRFLIDWHDECWQSNQDEIDELERSYFGAAVALILQLAFWSAALTDMIA